MCEITSIQIHTDTKQRLIELKIVSRESYEDVIKRLLELRKTKQEE